MASDGMFGAGCVFGVLLCVCLCVRLQDVQGDEKKSRDEDSKAATMTQTGCVCVWGCFVLMCDRVGFVTD